MRELKRRMRLLTGIVALVIAMASPGVQGIGALPDSLSLTAGSNTVLNYALPVQASLDAGDTGASIYRSSEGIEISAGSESGSAKLVFRLLGLVPVKQVDVEVSRERRLIPGGKSIGIALETEGLVVVGTSDLGSDASPARKAGLNAGDIITQVNGKDVRSAQELASFLQAGEKTVLTVARGEKTHTVELMPACDPRDGSARIGVWVRSSTAGVGTLTYVDPQTGEFGALGHAISDIDTGITMPVAEGEIYNSRIVQINRSEEGIPGEIVGDFLGEKEEIGKLTANNAYGVFGEEYSGSREELLYTQGMPVGKRSEVHTGSAQILTTVDDRIQMYDCEIEHIDTDCKDGLRSLVLRITDTRLIERTGGIVQGMSGSPIIQDGKLVGAVTHVLVNYPTRGYGIFIENMLEVAS